MFHKTKTNSHRKSYKQAIYTITAAFLFGVTVISGLGNGNLLKSAFAATGDTANVVIGRTDTSTTTDISVCVQSASGSFRLSDTSTWLSFLPADYSVPPTLQTTGKFSAGNGYSNTVFEDVSQPAGFTNDIWSLRTDFTGDGVTAGQIGLVVSTTRPELIGKVRFTKTVASSTPAINLVQTNHHSVEIPNTSMAITVTNVAYDCNATPVTQSNVTNSSNCISTLNVIVPATYTCNFILTGSLDNTYAINPAVGTNPIKISTGTDNTTTAILAGSASDDCTIINNGTVAAALNCINTKTVGSLSTGVKNVIMTVGTGTATDVGDVLLSYAVSTLNLKANLAGTYNTTTSLMNATLNTGTVIPTAQPYNVAPFNYVGTETIGGALSPNVVDWVLVEVRDNARAVVQERKAALLMKDGTIVNPTTQSGAITLTTITTAANYQIIIRHRNHLAISTSTGVALTAGSTSTLDYTTNTNVLGSNQSLLATGVFGLRNSNANGDSNIDATDRVQTRTGSEAATTYNRRDLNLDTRVDATDRAMVRSQSDATDGI